MGDPSVGAESGITGRVPYWLGLSVAVLAVLWLLWLVETVSLGMSAVSLSTHSDPAVASFYISAVRKYILLSAIHAAILVNLLLWARWLLLMAKRYSVAVDHDGITVTDRPNRVLHAAWHDLVEARVTSRGELMEITAGNQAIRISPLLPPGKRKLIASEVIARRGLAKVDENPRFSVYRPRG